MGPSAAGCVTEVNDLGRIAVAEAANRLGLSERVVRRLVARGDLVGERIAGRWVLDEDAVRRAAGRRTPAGRPLAPASAWNLLTALSQAAAAGAAASQDAGSVARWLDRAARRTTRSDSVGDAAQEKAARAFRDALERRLRHRLLAFLADHEIDDNFAFALRRRGVPRRYWIHPGVRDALLTDPRAVVGGAHALAATGADLSPGDSYRVYVRAGDLNALRDRYQLVEDPDGDLEVLVVPDVVPDDVAPHAGGPAPIAAALLDLLEEDDVRGRALAEGWLRALSAAARRRPDPAAVGATQSSAATPVGRAATGP